MLFVSLSKHSALENLLKLGELLENGIMAQHWLYLHLIALGGRLAAD